MGIKIFAIAMMLFLAEVVFLTTKDFKNSKPKKSDIDFTDIAFENVKSYLITKDGCDSKLESRQILKYKNYAKAYDVKTEFIKDEKKTLIKSKVATIKENKIYLTEDVEYEDNQSLHIKSQDLVYNTKTKVAVIDSNFVLTTKNGKVQGKKLIYDQKNGTIKAKDIKYTTFEIEE